MVAPPSPLGDIRVVGTIDLTPTWSDVVRVWTRIIRDVDAVGRTVLMEECARMALAADRHQALVKLAEADERVGRSERRFLSIALNDVVRAERTQNEDNAEQTA